MHPHVEWVAFDLYGTLLDIAGLRGAVERAGAAADVLDRWRKAQLERTWELNRRGQYQPFDRVTADALAEVAPELPADAQRTLCDAWLTLPPHPDAQAALRQLRLAGKKAAVLSNGTAALIRAALGSAQLEVDAVLSADHVQMYKPDARVYALLDSLDAREHVLFVSANGWDAEGAKRDGRQVAFLDRGGAPPALPPDLRARSLQELSDTIAPPDWRTSGVRVIRGDQLDPNTTQTPGMSRAAAITRARTGAEKLWAGTVTIHANTKTSAHHHGALESVIFVVRGRARMRWGEALQYTAEAGPGDFIYVPPYVPHQEINASATESLECVLVRSGGDAVVVNLDLAPAEKPEEVPWVDPIHRPQS